MGNTTVNTKKETMHTYIKILIGLLIMFGFPQLPPFEPITEMGMWVMGIFIGMIYLWSTVGSFWPSLLGLVMMGCIGYAGEGAAGMKAVVSGAFGLDALIIVLLTMLLFGGLQYYGCCRYIARFFLTRKIVNGRPYVFMGMFYLVCFVLAALTSSIAALIVVWPIAVDIFATLNLKREDKLFPLFIMGSFVSCCFGQATLPFKGATMVILSSFEQFSGEVVNPATYIIFTVTMGIVVMIPAYLAMVKFIFRPDVSKMKNVTVEQIEAEKLPPIDFRQKSYLWMLLPYGIMVLLPNLFPGSTNSVITFLSTLGTLGVNAIFLVVMCIIRSPQDGKPLMEYRQVAAKNVSWDVFFLVAAAVYIANALSSDITGIKDWIIMILTPVLSNAGTWMFVVLIFAIALLLTNFGNNVAMAIVLMPIICTFCAERGIPAMPVAVGATLMVFVAILTPSAAPHASMMFARKDLISTKEIYKYGVPCCLLTLAVYSIIAYPLLTILFG